MRQGLKEAQYGLARELAIMDADPTKTFEDMKAIAAGARSEALWRDGDLEAGVFTASGVMGLIHDVPTCAELIERVVAEAEGIMRTRLPGMAG